MDGAVFPLGESESRGIPEAANWFCWKRIIRIGFQALPIGRQHQRYRRAVY